MKRAVLFLCLSLLSSAFAETLAEVLPKAVTFSEDAVNTIVVELDGKSLAINSSGGRACDTLLLTHARRDIVRAARSGNAGRVFASEASYAVIEESESFWLEWWDDRFDYYQQQVTRRPTRTWDIVQPLPKTSFDWEGHPVEILPTPGYTRDAVTYLIELQGKKVAFVGDLILAGGKVRDLYSFQNEIREAKIGGYHGHLGRLHIWLESLERLRAEAPDLLVPSRGPVSQTPDRDIEQAMKTARVIYRNYLSTNALHWYFGEERMNTCAELVLGKDHGVRGMPLAEHVDLPTWCRHIGTTKLLVSESGNAFALDVGGAKSLQTLQQVAEDNLIGSLDGIFATHTHNDHTAAISEAAKHFGSPVYALPDVADVLRNPGHWFLPGVSNNEVAPIEEVVDRQKMQWEEFQFTFYFYPGQMYNHGALLVEKPDHDPVFFIGDSFSPSGIDDYCMMNRNLMRDDTGYALCFQILEELPEDTWLVNQHIPHLFRFTTEERNFLLSRYRKRAEWIADFVAWDDLNFAIDEQWASFYPYGQIANPGQTVETEVRIWNHSKQPREYTVELNHPDLDSGNPKTVVIEGRASAVIPFSIPVPEADNCQYVVTADIQRNDGHSETAFCESLIRVGRPEPKSPPPD